jgi:N-acetylneuraminate synthase
MRTVGGLSLTARAVLVGRRFAAGWRLADAAVVVDTDDEAIAQEGRRFGAEVPFLRAPALAQDDTPTAESVLGCIDRLSAVGRPFDAVILLQPTSPLRTPADVAACWRRFDPFAAPSVVAVTPTEHPAALVVRMDGRGGLDWSGGSAGGGVRRQDVPPSYRIAGSVYVSTVASLRSHGTFVVPGTSVGVVIPAEHALDVDSATDLAVADAWRRIASAATPTVAVGTKRIGGGAPCYLIAEAGVNHNGDPNLAHRLVDVAADSGADAVKFQTFTPERLASAGAMQASYQAANTGVVESQLAMLRRLALPAEHYPLLKAHAEERGLTFLSSPFDEQSADFLEALGVPAFKIPSGELTNLPFLAHVARKGRPMLVSSGMSTLAEVAEALLTIESHGNSPVALFHCVTSYPTRPDQCNLAAMATMRAAFGYPVGWSDHTEGTDVSVVAASLGAEMIEKHFTLDRSLPGPDQQASLEPAEFSCLVASVRRVEAARGTGEKMPVAAELECAELVRKSLHAKSALEGGHRLRAEDLVALRPGGGLPPAALVRVVGRRLRIGVTAGTMLREEDLE